MLVLKLLLGVLDLRLLRFVNHRHDRRDVRPNLSELRGHVGAGVAAEAARETRRERELTLVGLMEMRVDEHKHGLKHRHAGESERARAVKRASLRVPA
eukprot:6206364-Pleurochrysis_carterae.AAC.5